MNKYVKLFSSLTLIPLLAGCVLFSNPVPTNTINLSIQPYGTNGQPLAKASFNGKFHKDVNIGAMTVVYNPVTGALTWSATNWASTNNVAVINASFAGQNAEQATMLNGAANLMNGAANLMKGAATAYATGGASTLAGAVLTPTAPAPTPAVTNVK